MLSKPPATTTLLSPNPIDNAPNDTVFNPDEQTLFTVVQGTVLAMPFKEKKIY